MSGWVWPMDSLGSPLDIIPGFDSELYLNILVRDAIRMTMNMAPTQIHYIRFLVNKTQFLQVLTKGRVKKNGILLIFCG